MAMEGALKVVNGFIFNSNDHAWGTKYFVVNICLKESDDWFLDGDDENRLR